MRATIAIPFALVLAGGVAGAKGKHKEKPLKSNPGGASLLATCQQIAEAECDLAKRCKPDWSLRYCRKARARCTGVSDAASRVVTEDDANVCAGSIGNLGCNEVRFDDEQGVEVDLGRLEVCSTVAKDPPWQLEMTRKTAHRAKTKTPPTGDDTR